MNYVVGAVQKINQGKKKNLWRTECQKEDHQNSGIQRGYKRW